MPYGFFIVGSGWLCLALAAIAWWNRRMRGAPAWMILMLAIALWTLGYSLELRSTTIPDKVFWAKIEYLGIAIIPPIWLVFAARYTGHDRWLTRRVQVLLFLPALLELLLVWTNESHHLIWRSIALVPYASFVGWKASYGTGFWICTAYAYTLLAGGTGLFA